MIFKLAALAGGISLIFLGYLTYGEPPLVINFIQFSVHQNWVFIHLMRGSGGPGTGKRKKRITQKFLSLKMGTAPAKTAFRGKSNPMEPPGVLIGGMGNTEGDPGVSQALNEKIIQSGLLMVLPSTEGMQPSVSGIPPASAVPPLCGAGLWEGLKR